MTFLRVNIDLDLLLNEIEDLLMIFTIDNKSY